MPDPTKALGNGHERAQQIRPGHLTAPTPVVPLVGVSQTPVGPRVLLRIETPTGMFVVLLEPDVADSLSKGLHDSAVMARTGITIAKQGPSLG